MSTLWVMVLFLTINGEPDYDTLHQVDTLYLTQEECIAAAKAEAEAAASDPGFVAGLVASPYDDLVIGCVPHKPTYEDGAKTL